MFSFDLVVWAILLYCILYFGSYAVHRKELSKTEELCSPTWCVEWVIFSVDHHWWPSAFLLLGLHQQFVLWKKMLDRMTCFVEGVERAISQSWLYSSTVSWRTPGGLLGCFELKEIPSKKAIYELVMWLDYRYGSTRSRTIPSLFCLHCYPWITSCFFSVYRKHASEFGHGGISWSKLKQVPFAQSLLFFDRIIEMWYLSTVMNIFRWPPWQREKDWRPWLTNELFWSKK